MQGICYNRSTYLPYSTCDYGSEYCDTSMSFSNATGLAPNVRCYAGFNLCLNQDLCNEAIAKRSCSNNRTIITSLSASNSCYVPANLDVQFTVVEQTGPPAMRFGMNPLDSSRINQEIKLNRSIDNNSCVSADAQAMLSYNRLNASLSSVKLMMRLISKADGKVLAQCQPTYGFLLPPKSKPETAFPTVVLRRNSTGSSYYAEYVYPANLLRSAGNQSNVTAPWCDSLGADEFPSSERNAQVRQLCREAPWKAAYCYIEAPPLYTDYTLSAYSYNYYYTSYWAPVMPFEFGLGYLMLTVDNTYMYVYLRQPGSASLVCRSWNGLLPTRNTPPTDNGYFGDELLRIDYSLLCSAGNEPCLATKSCIPIGNPCRQRLNCSSSEVSSLAKLAPRILFHKLAPHRCTPSLHTIPNAKCLTGSPIRTIQSICHLFNKLQTQIKIKR